MKQFIILCLSCLFCIQSFAGYNHHTSHHSLKKSLPLALKSKSSQLNQQRDINISYGGADIAQQSMITAPVLVA